MNERRYATLQDRAQKDLGCPAASLEHAYAGGLHRMAGCGKRAEYVLHCPGGWACTWLDSPAKDAAFTTNCPIEQLQVTQISEGKYGVSGCDSRISFVARCQGYQCAWVADIASATTSPSGAAPAVSPTPSAGDGRENSTPAAPSVAPAAGSQ